MAQAFEGLEVVVDDGGGANATGLLNVANAWWVVVLANEVADKAQDGLLLGGEGFHHCCGYSIHRHTGPKTGCLNACSGAQVYGSLSDNVNWDVSTFFL